MPVHVPEFIVTAWLLAMLPGVGQAVVLRQTLERGLRAAVLTITGTCIGLLLWTTAAAAGLSAILLANNAAYTIVRLIGALVLAYLGVSSLLRLRGSAEDRAPVPAGRGAFASGLATNLGNPKAGVFAVSLIPQFVEPGGAVLASSLALGLTWAAVTACWYGIFVATVHRGRALVTRPSARRWLQGTTGIVLLLLGGAVAIGV